MKDIMGEELEAKVIYSGSLNDSPRLNYHFTTKKEQEDIIKPFKQPMDSVIKVYRNTFIV